MGEQMPSKVDALRAAVSSKDSTSVGRLLPEMEDLEARDKFGRTVLHQAALTTVEIVEMLVASGADITAVDMSGDTPLHKAAKAGRTHVVSLLLRTGASADVRNRAGQLPWDLARTVDRALADTLLPFTPEVQRLTPTAEEAAKIQSLVLLRGPELTAAVKALGSPEELLYFAESWNWDDGVSPILEIVKHPACSLFTAREIYLLAEGPYFSGRPLEGVEDWERPVFTLVQEIESRFPKVHDRA